MRGAFLRLGLYGVAAGGAALLLLDAPADARHTVSEVMPVTLGVGEHSAAASSR